MAELIFQSKTKVNPSHFFNKYVAAYIGRQAPRLREKRNYDLAVFANDFIGIQINVFGLYEKEELEVLFDFFLPLKDVFKNSLALDIGANIGNHTVFFADKFQQVFAFEPNPSTVYLLNFNTSQFSNITVFNFGLGDKEGSFQMSQSLSNMGGSSILTSSSNQNLVDIQLKTLDSIPIQAEDVSLIKIDVEGFEYKVLKGGKNLIEKYQPLVLMEHLENEFDQNISQSVFLLKELGYEFCWHLRGIDAKTWVPKPLVRFIEMITGRRQMVFTSHEIPKGNYPMLIAVPKRFQKILRLKR